jgi:hypothetical protein
MNKKFKLFNNLNKKIQYLMLNEVISPNCIGAGILDRFIDDETIKLSECYVYE